MTRPQVLVVVGSVVDRRLPVIDNEAERIGIAKRQVDRLVAEATGFTGSHALRDPFALPIGDRLGCEWHWLSLYVGCHPRGFRLKPEAAWVA
jgi:hypothetical protein